MSNSASEIERVVREVLAELGVAPNSPSLAPGEDQGDRTRRKVEGGREKGDNQGLGTLVPSAMANADLLVDSRVVAMAEISGRLESVRRLIVAKNAIVTPAVRDELHRLGIALKRINARDPHSAAPVRLAMILSGTDYCPEALIAALAREDLRVELLDSDCLIAAVDRLAGEVARPDTLGVQIGRASCRVRV